jgi:PAS domain S-box-containing protein
VEPCPTVFLASVQPAPVFGAEQVQALLAFSRETAAARDEGELGRAVAHGLAALFPERAFCLRFLDPKTLALTSLHVRGRLRPQARDRVVLRRTAVRKTGLCEQALTAAGLVVGDRDDPVLEGCERATAVPLAAGGLLFGVLHVEYAPGSPGSPEGDEPILLQLANHGAIALRNLRALEEVTFLKGFLEDLIENANALVLVADRQRRVLVFNRALRRLTGLSGEAALGSDLALLAPPEERRRIETAFARAFDAEPVAGFETRILVAGGGEARILVNTSALYGASGEVEGMIAIGQDMTALRALERNAEEAQRLAELGQLAAGIVHELGNPLTAVTMYSEALHAKLARQPAPDAADLDKLRAIRDAGERLLKFSRELMAYAKPPPERLEEVDVAEVAAQALRVCEPVLGRARARVERRVEPAPRIQAVAGQLLQLFVNLLTNAAQALPPDGGEIALEVRAGPCGVEAKVRDGGAGMPPEVRRRIFEPFFTTKGDGTGLGLCIVQRIVARHGGELAVESAPGAGTTFTIALPVHPPI